MIKSEVMKKIACLTWALALVLGSGCQTVDPVPLAKGDAVAASRADAAVPRDAGLTNDSRDGAMPERELAMVRLRPGLVINFSLLVSGQEEFGEKSKRISDAGMLVLPLLGTVTVKDATLEQLGEQLTELYRKYYVNPQVILDFVRDTSPDGVSPWGYVTVLGRVKSPGRISLPATRDLTVSGAIQKAGGFNSSARGDAILVTRRAADGTQVTREVNLLAVGTGRQVTDDMMLQAEDVVFVPEARF